MLVAWISLYTMAVILWSIGTKKGSMPFIYIGWACFIPGVIVSSLWMGV